MSIHSLLLECIVQMRCCFFAIRSLCFFSVVQGTIAPLRLDRKEECTPPYIAGLWTYISVFFLL